MTELPVTLGILAGVIAGFVHVTMLWMGSHRPSVWSGILGPMRLAVVCVILVLAAINGQIIVTASAWAVSFAALAILFLIVGAYPFRPSRPRLPDRPDDPADRAVQGKPPHAA